MNDPQQLRTAVIGLIAFAGTEEQMLLEAARAHTEGGSPQAWAARPLAAHNTEFKRHQVQRLEAVRAGETPPEFPQIDHGSDEVYRRYGEPSDKTVTESSRLTTLALIDEVRRAGDADLLDSSRHPWLAGRQLWLQTVVRGFWHPTGHLGEYYLVHGQLEAAIALQARAVVLGALLSAPEPARGMACYNIACAQARAGMPAAALDTLKDAIGLNPDLVSNARRDTDLDRLREDGRLEELLNCS
jgi:tetratricopeptide (TPR) repeat protein